VGPVLLVSDAITSAIDVLLFRACGQVEDVAVLHVLCEQSERVVGCLQQDASWACVDRRDLASVVRFATCPTTHNVD